MAERLPFRRCPCSRIAGSAAGQARERLPKLCVERTQAIRRTSRVNIVNLLTGANYRHLVGMRPLPVAAAKYFEYLIDLQSVEGLILKIGKIPRARQKRFVIPFAFAVSRNDTLPSTN
jgi:hypothetical protein